MNIKLLLFAFLCSLTVSSCNIFRESEYYHDNLYWLMSNSKDYYDKNKRFPVTFAELNIPMSCGISESNTAYPYSELKTTWSPVECKYSYKMKSNGKFIAFCVVDFFGNTIDYIDSETDSLLFLRGKVSLSSSSAHQC